MELETSRVHRNLDGKLKVMGLEAPDLILVLLLAAIMNLLFGQTSFVLPLVFGLSSVLLAVLYIGKRGKPQDYLIHLIKYLANPGFYSAGDSPSNEMNMKKEFYEKTK